MFPIHHYDIIGDVTNAHCINTWCYPVLVTIWLDGIMGWENKYRMVHGMYSTSLCMVAQWFMIGSAGYYLPVAVWLSAMAVWIFTSLYCKCIEIIQSMYS